MLVKNEYTVDYYTTEHLMDANRLNFLSDAGVNVITFGVERRILKRFGYWEGTDFWSKFDSDLYDCVLTSIYGGKEYPFHLLKIPVIEQVMFASTVTTTRNVMFTILPSDYLRRKWIRNGGMAMNSTVIPTPAWKPVVTDNLRCELGIPSDAIVAGFHQRVDDYTFSHIPLEAFCRHDKENFFFLLMGGSVRYRKQARELGLKNIRFLEHSSDKVDISKFLNSLNVFSHGRYDGETYGGVFAEALMHGLPCISHFSAIDNAHFETVGPHGFVVKNVFDYAHLLGKFFNDEDLRMKLSERSKEFAHGRYGESIFETKILGVFADLDRNALHYLSRNNSLFRLRVFFNAAIKRVLLLLLLPVRPRSARNILANYIQHRFGLYRSNV